MLLRDLPFGGGKPPNYHLGGDVYHPNLYAMQLGCPQLIPLKSYRSCNRGTSWRDANDLDLHKDYRCAVNKINNSVDALYPSWEPNSCSSTKFDAWGKARFTGLPNSSSAMKVLFDGWDSWIVHAGAEAKKFMVQMIKDINAQVIEGKLSILPLLFHSVNDYCILFCYFCHPFGDEEDQHETLAEQEPAAVPTETSGTDEELREAFEAVGQEKDVDVSVGDKKKGKEVEEEEIPAEIIVESIALAKQQQEAQGT
ncbi:unnamed protein product [Prunus brigantina]